MDPLKVISFITLTAICATAILWVGSDEQMVALVEDSSFQEVLTCIFCTVGVILLTRR